jgi:chromosome partitioning protein
MKEVIIKEAWHSLDLIPSNINLSGAEVELLNEEDPQSVIKDKLDKVKRSYDYVIIDCPPSLSILTINALSAAGSVIVPIQCEYYALEGLSQLIDTIQLVKDRINQKLKIEGILFTMYDVRNRLSSQVVENVREHVEQHVYETVIPRNIRLAEAPSYGEPITVYDKKSSGAAAYRALAKEVILKDSI